MTFFQKKEFFLSSFFIIIIIFGCSFISFFYRPLSAVFFFLIILATLYLSLKNWEYGFFIALGELIAGSFGRLFTVEIGQWQISLRIGIFLILALVFLIKYYKKQLNWPIKNSSFSRPFLFFGIFVMWAVINGLLKNNGLNNIFFDANAFLFFFYIFLFFEIINSELIIKKIILLLGAGGLAVSLLTLIYFVIFSIQPANLMVFYKWIRDYRFGEITPVFLNIYRIFFQAQIYCLIALLVFSSLCFFNHLFKKNANEKIINIFLIIIIFLTSLTMIISFSRSNWVGEAGALIFILFGLFFWLKAPFKKLLAFFAFLVLIIILNIGLLFILSGNFTGNLLKNRLALNSEPAGLNRLNELKPLIGGIEQNFWLGAGFGKTLTYKSLDPRVLTASPNGEYTTYAFEWGYLDLFLKLGFFGFLAYIYLVFKTFKEGVILITKSGLDQNRRFLIIGLLAGLLAVILVNIFSPYLNHPLGIGYLLIVIAIFTYYVKTQKTPSLN